MNKIIILGGEGSGKKTLKEKITPLFPDYTFDVYSRSSLSSYDAAILVVSLVDGPMPDTRKQLIEARSSDIKNIFCFLNKNDLVEDQELSDLVDMEVQEVAKNAGYSDVNFFITKGIATQGEGVNELLEQIKANISKEYVFVDSNLPEYKCSGCGRIEHIKFDVCNACGKKRKVSFWEKLFG